MLVNSQNKIQAFSSLQFLSSQPQSQSVSALIPSTKKTRNERNKQKTHFKIQRKINESVTSNSAQLRGARLIQAKKTYGKCKKIGTQ